MEATRILSGREVSQSVYASLQTRIERLRERGCIPGLAAVLVGDNPASRVYVRNKTRKFRSLDLLSEVIQFPSTVSSDEVCAKIEELNRDDSFHGILVQLPLPKQWDVDRVLDGVVPHKDVDGFHPENLGRLTAGRPRFVPCTSKGIMRLLEYYHIDPGGKHVVVLGRSNIVGRPVSILTSLKRKFANATTTLCHSATGDIGHFTRQADIVIVALGVPHFLTAEEIREGAVVIDVGINRVEDDSEKGYRLVGDVDQDSVLGKAGALTPVPGGVGPMTIAMLVENTVEAAERALHIESE